MGGSKNRGTKSSISKGFSRFSIVTIHFGLPRFCSCKDHIGSHHPQIMSEVQSNESMLKLWLKHVENTYKYRINII